jgi:hypothetical protein
MQQPQYFIIVIIICWYFAIVMINIKKKVECQYLIAHRHLLMHATSERGVPTLVTFNGYHWLNQL